MVTGGNQAALGSRTSSDSKLIAGDRGGRSSVVSLRGPTYGVRGLPGAPPPHHPWGGEERVMCNI